MSEITTLSLSNLTTSSPDPSGLSTSLVIAQYVVGIPLGLLLLAANTVLLIMFSCPPQGGADCLKLRIIVANMAAADLLLGVITVVTAAISGIQPVTVAEVFSLIGLLQLLPMGTSLLFLMLVGITPMQTLEIYIFTI